MADLLSPATFGALSLRNRLVMAPMTRSRADPAGNATGLTVEFEPRSLYLQGAAGYTDYPVTEAS